MTFRTMTVCTGDICRSPYAERVLADAFESVQPGVFTVERRASIEGVPACSPAGAGARRVQCAADLRAAARGPWGNRLAGARSTEGRWSRTPLELARERVLSRADPVDDVPAPFRLKEAEFRVMAEEIDVQSDASCRWRRDSGRTRATPTAESRY